MKKLVILVRGPSGCGKSTHVEFLKRAYLHPRTGKRNIVICSTDNFFIHFAGKDGDGKFLYRYAFDPTKLSEAHQDCYGRFLDALKNSNDKTVVIVDNTFIKKWEYENYVKAVELAGATILIHEFRAQTFETVKTLAARNVHKVPAEVILRQCYDFEPDENAKIIPIPLEGEK